MTADNPPTMRRPETASVPPRILLGPGPSMVNTRVLRAMMENMIGYLDPDYVLMLEDVSDLLKRVFQTEDATTMALSGTGSSGMEAGLSSILEPGDTVVVCIYGFFGERMVDMATRVGANVVPLRSEWGAPFPEEMLQTALNERSDVKLVAAIHAETSTGVRQPLEGMSRLAKEHDALFMVDAVTSLGGNEVVFDDWDIDYCYSATQKCLGCPPGLSPVAVSQRAMESIRSRKTPPASWYLDLNLNANYWYDPRVYHHTSPVSMVLALREGLRIVLEEGLQNRFARHERNAAALRAGLESLGLELVPPDGYRLAQVTSAWIPEGVVDAQVRARLLSEYNIEIGKGLGRFDGRVWRFGLMGESSKADYVLLALSALESILPSAGYEVAPGVAVSAASKALSSPA